MFIEYNKEKIELPEQITLNQLLEKLADNKLSVSKKSVLGALVNGESRDLSTVLKAGDQVSFLTFANSKGEYMFWHTSAHLLAQAVLRLFPHAKATIGPPIEQGFYYDFAELEIIEQDFAKIEKEVQKIIRENHNTERIEYKNKQEALAVFGDNPFKKELIEQFGENLSAYQQGEFVDLCRGPHIPNLGKIGAFKILKTSGSYWRADANNQHLTRIYAISYPEKKQLKDYLYQLAEAQKRDHRVLGKKLQLFSFHPEAPGMPLFHPKGILLWNRMMEFWREAHQGTYQEIKTPIMLSQDLWVASGHWDNYRENMYLTKIDKTNYAIKPMNCPGCLIYYNSNQYSYRQLPLRIAEIGHVHRHELKGALGGLFRVRAFHQDDAHIFMTPKDIAKEIMGVLKLSEKIYACFGLAFQLELSTRPKKSIGSDEQWRVATEALQSALEKGGYHYQLNEGDGAFYGPKIDMHIKDALRRTWQCGTIQLDMILPERFDLGYTDKQGKRARPIMIHRTVMGSIERFMGVLIEHFSGRFPFWMSPNQIKILPVADRFLAYANSLKENLAAHEWIVEVDNKTESIAKKVRAAQLEQWNYILVVGEKEQQSQKLNIRIRAQKETVAMSIENFIQTLKDEQKTRSLKTLVTNHKE